MSHRPLEKMFLVILFFLLVAIVLATAVVLWPLSPQPTLKVGQFDLIVGNGVDNNFLSALAFQWPFIYYGNQVAVNYVFQLPAVTTLSQPSLPVLVSLPTPTRGDLKGYISSTSIPLPGSDEDLTVVQVGQAIGFRFVPSGNYLRGQDLTASYGIVFTVTYTMA